MDYSSRFLPKRDEFYTFVDCLKLLITPKRDL